MIKPPPYTKLCVAIAWHRYFHGEFPKTIWVTKVFAQKLYRDKPRLKRYKKILGAKVKVIPEKIQGKSLTHVIFDDLEGDLDINAPWSLNT